MLCWLPTLPLTDPIPIFLLVLLIILCAPLLNRARIPHIVGLILAGMALGPNGLNVLANDASFDLFGKVGILYIMFLAGLETDVAFVGSCEALIGFSLSANAGVRNDTMQHTAINSSLLVFLIMLFVFLGYKIIRYGCHIASRRLT